jgi:hypothetical protein
VNDAPVVSDLSTAVLVTRPGESLGSTVTISIDRVGGRRLGQVTGDELLGCVSLYEVFSMTGVTAVPGTTYRVTASDDGDFLGSATFTYQP